MSMLARFLQREKRFIKSEKIAFLVLPLVLLPLLLEVVLHGRYGVWFGEYKDEILIGNMLWVN